MTRQAKDGAGDLAAKRAYWKKRIAEWERSGQSQRAFCAERELALATFQWWRAKLRRVEARPPRMPFVPLALNAAAPLAGASIEVELRSKTRLRFEGEAALAAVAQLAAHVK